MARILKQQPNGLFAEWSTIIDGFVVVNATEEELINLARQEAADEAEKRMRERFDDLKAGRFRTAYGVRPWDELLALHNARCTPDLRLNDDGTLQTPEQPTA